MVKELRLPLVGGRVEAGFPSPADDFIERSIDLNEQMVTNPIATFFVRASGRSMQGAGIVIAIIDGGLTVKRLRKRDAQASLVPEPNEVDQGAYGSIEVGPDTDAIIWGVVTWSVHNLQCTH